MTDVWLFGTFRCANRLNTQDTKDYKVAKWRSKYKVPKGSAVTGGYVSGAQYNWVQVEFNGVVQCHAIYLTDLEYQLRDTTPKSSADLWLKFTNSSTRRAADDYLWYRAGDVIEYQEPAYNPNPLPSSSNPFVKPVPTPKPLIDLGYLDFVEERLELGFDYGAVGGMAFKTEIVEVAEDREQRNALRYLPLGRWQLGERLLLESEVEAIQEVSYLKDFHAARRGSFQGFRFKDWSDYQAVNQLIGVGDGIKTQFQLRKAYAVGDAVFYRPITKVALQADWRIDIRFYPDGFESAITLEKSTGIVTCDPALPLGCEMSASFEFDVPVWFESDQIGFGFKGYDRDTNEAIYQLESCFVVEGRIPISDWVAEPNAQIETALNLGIIYDTVEQYDFSTVKQELQSGYVKRESKHALSRLSFNLGSRNYNREEIEKILSYFWLAKGKLRAFPFRNLDKTYTVRFDQDELNLKFEVASKNELGDVDEALFSLPGLKLQAVPATGLMKYLTPETTVYFCFDTSGSIDYSLSAINEAVDQWQELLADFYGETDWVKTQVINFSDERWLKLPSIHYKKNALYLIWTCEAAPSYHSTVTFTPAAADFETDKNDFLDSYDQRDFCKIIVHSLSMNGAAFDIFNGQLFAAQEGVLGYSPPLKDYGLDIKLTIDPDTSAGDWLNYFKTEEIATDFEGAGGAPFEGLLQYVNRNTQIYFCLDTSGSIDYSLPAISAAIADWKIYLGTIYYGADWVDTHTQTVNYTHERWLKVPNDNFSPDALYLIWSSEAEPFYHSSSSFSPAAADFLTDRTNFLANFANRQSCKIIVHSLSLYGSAFGVFNSQLEAAKEGTSGYSPALKNYGLDIKLTINPDTSAAQWLNYFKTLAIATNFAGVGGVPPVVFPTAGLIHYYRLETLPPLIDQIGTSPLTALNKGSGLVDLITGVNGNGLSYSTGLRGFGGIRLRNSHTSFSLSVWYKVGSASNNNVIFGDQWFVGDTDGTLRAYVFNNCVRLCLIFSDLSVWHYSGTTIITDGNWHNIVFIFDVSTKNFSLYVDNILQFTANRALNVNVSSNYFYFNVSEFNVGGNNCQWDEIGIWNRASNPSEISELYNNGAGTFY